MTDIQRNLLLGVIVAILIIAGGYWYTHRTSQTPTSPEESSTTTPSAGIEEGVSGTGDFTVEQVGIEPPLLGPIVISDSFPKDAAAILRSKIEAQYAILQKEPTRVDIWLQLGVNRKIGSDFDGAIEAWNYVIAAAPDNLRAVAYGNLGDLYLYFLKEYDKSEENFKKAITLNPDYIDYYRTLYYLYRDVYKDPAKEADILAQGLVANPGDPDLLELQHQLASSTAQ